VLQGKSPDRRIEAFAPLHAYGAASVRVGHHGIVGIALNQPVRQHNADVSHSGSYPSVKY